MRTHRMTHIQRWNRAKILALFLYPAIPLLAPLGFYANAPWLSAVCVFVFIPAIDILLPNDGSGNLAADEPRGILRWWLRNLPQVYVLLWLGVLCWALLVLRAGSLTFGETAWLIFSVGIASAFATCAAHELLHWPERPARAFARLTMATVAYGHFPIEHVHHHAQVGIRHEGTTPPLGQSVWSFLLTNVLFSFRSAWNLERRRRVELHGLARNRFLQQWLLTALIMAFFVTVAGASGLLLFAVQAVLGIYTTEFVNYAQHYGLARDADHLVTPELSWSSNGLATNAVTLNITRHAHHHVQSELRYYELEHLSGAPALPAGYLALFFPAMIPKVWRSLMDRRARLVRSRDRALSAAA